MNLPMAYMTEFTARFSYRSLSKLCGYLKYHNTAIFNELARRVLNAVGWPLSEMVDSHIKDDIFPSRGPNLDTTSVSATGYHTVVRISVPLSLRAQIVRHRDLSIVDDVPSMARVSQYYWSPVSHEVVMEVGAPNHVWRRITQSRNCWLAHTGLWKDLLMKVVEGIGSEEFLRSL